MAKGQQQGIGSITVWMIIFVALWLTSTVFLVILYTGQADLNNELQRLRTANDRLISRAEENSLELVREAAPSRDGGPTVVGLLEGARSQTALLAVGDEANDVETIRRKRDQVMNRIVADRIVPNVDEFENLSLYDGMVRLYEALRTEHDLRQAAEERVEQLETEVTKLTEANAEQKNDFDTRLEELDGRLGQIEADRAAYIAERDETIARIRQDFEKERAQANIDLTTERQYNTDLRRDLGELRKRFIAQQEKFGQVFTGPQDLTTARQADGRILTAFPGDDVVYIDLGAEDRLMLGLQFSVYSAEMGIPPNGQGKAQIEVVSIAPTSAECKIIRTTREDIVLEGDLIANPVYDPKRPITFVTVGEFDLDRDGQYDPDGRATIESMITAWGGVITEELTALTDFLIVGGAPPRPRVSRDVSAGQRAHNEALQQAYDEYLAIVGSARSLSVPAMSQDVFLNFLGCGIRLARR